MTGFLRYCLNSTDKLPGLNAIYRTQLAGSGKCTYSWWNKYL